VTQYQPDGESISIMPNKAPTLTFDRLDSSVLLEPSNIASNNLLSVIAEEEKSSCHEKYGLNANSSQQIEIDDSPDRLFGSKSKLAEHSHRGSQFGSPQKRQ
jgi:hypothetical protein